MTEPETASASTFATRVLAREEVAAERLIGWVRIVSSIGIAATYFLTLGSLEWLGLVMPILRPASMPEGAAPVIRGLFVVLLLFFSGLIAVYLTRKNRWRSWMPYGFAFADAALLTYAIVRPLTRYELPSAFAPMATAAFAVPLALALGSLRPQPKVQLTFIILFVAFLGISLFVWGNPLTLPTPDEMIMGARFLDIQSNLGRLILLIAAGLTIALGVARSRVLLVRAIRENEQNRALTRFLPSEIASQIALNRFDSLRRGERRILTIMFIDMRESTALGETLDPVRLAIFISSFRRRVLNAVSVHGGVVDKFIGDGALVVFGLQDNEGSALAAVTAAQELFRLIDRWNIKRSFKPPIHIGIGIHTGEAFMGVVGTAERMEFTVLGDTVNIAARLEQLSKETDSPLLISATTFAAAHLGEDWQLRQDRHLRGRSGEVDFYAWTPQRLPSSEQS